MGAFPAVDPLVTYSYTWRSSKSKKRSYVLCSGTEKDNELKDVGFFKRGGTERKANAAFSNGSEIKPLSFFSPRARCK